MKFFTLTIFFISSITFAEQNITKEDVNKLISKSQKTRNQIENKNNPRMPANSITNWKDFENVMKRSDEDWDKEIDDIIKEYN